MGKPLQNELKTIDPDKSQAITLSLMELASLGRCETDEQVEARIKEFFYICSKEKIRPGVESLSLALGISRKTLYAWSTGRGCSPYRQECIQKAKSLINGYIEQAFLSGAINPVSGIFCLKNLAGWKDSISIEANTTFDTDRRMIDRKEIASQLGIMEEGDLEDIETDD